MKPQICGTLLALLSLCHATTAEDSPITHFPDRAWAGWLQIDYPSRFKMDPQSLEGESKWWAKFDDPLSALSLEIMAFGYINDLSLLMTIPGITWQNYVEKLDADPRPVDVKIAKDAQYKNCGDYFRAKILPQGTEEKKFPGYERFIAKKKDSVEVYFLDRDAYTKIYGRCYQTLVFRFPEGSLAKQWKTIEAVIASAIPPYRADSEPEEPRKVAPASDSK